MRLVSVSLLPSLLLLLLLLLLLQQVLSTTLASAAVTWTMSSLQVPWSGSRVNVTWQYAAAAKDDWLCVMHGDSALAVVSSLGTKFGTTGTVEFTLYNMRLGGYSFRYFNSTATSAQSPPVSVSPTVSFQRADSEPTEVHLALTGRDSEMRVTWTSSQAAQPSVWIGAAAGAYDRVVAAASSVTYSKDSVCEPPPDMAGAWVPPGWIHSAVIDGLTPGSTYHYRVGDAALPDAMRGADLVFDAPLPAGAAPDAEWSMIMYADMGVEQPFCAQCDVEEIMNWGVGAAPMIARIAADDLQSADPKRRPQLIGHWGDISYARNNAFKWPIFFNTIAPVAQRIPYMVSVGNHEYDHLQGGTGKDPSGPGAGDAGWHPSWGNQGDDSNGECGVPTFHRFPSPASDGSNAVFWHSFEHNNAHFTVISGEHDLTPGSPQYQWLVKDLASVDRTRTPWLLLNTHRPMYTSEEGEDSDYKFSLNLQQLLGDLMQKYSVDLFMSGHYHSYERTAPVYNETVMGDESDMKATVHICVGTAGIGFDWPSWMGKPWSRKQYATVYAYGRFHVYNSTDAQWTLVNSLTGDILDDVHLHSTHNFLA